MSLVTVQLAARVRRSFRVEQMVGMFDLDVRRLSPFAPRKDVLSRSESRLCGAAPSGQVPPYVLRHELTAEVPGLDEPWSIGMIVGPSGSGKTTLARAAFGDALYQPQPWPDDEAIVEVLGQRLLWSARSASGGAAAGVCALVTAGGASAVGDAPARGASGPQMISIKHLARVLTAVGLGSVPTWLKPYRVLSTGERARANVARAVIQGAGIRSQESGDSVLAIDEFTSMLDRTTARTLSAALSRLVRSLTPDSCPLTPGRLVVLTCHADIVPWLAADWVVELGSGVTATGSGVFGGKRSSIMDSHRPPKTPDPLPVPRLIRGPFPQPTIELDVRRVPQAMWQHFAPHHYLAGGLARSATCYAAWEVGPAGPAGLDAASGSSREEPGPAIGTYARWSGATWRDEKSRRAGGTYNALATQPLAFCAVVAALGWKKTKRITRLVTLPQYQGLGIGMRLAEAVAAIEARRGFRVTITATHPAVLAHCSRSPAWRLIGVKKTGSTPQRMAGRTIRSSTGRAVASFEWRA